MGRRPVTGKRLARPSRTVRLLPGRGVGVLGIRLGACRVSTPSRSPSGRRRLSRVKRSEAGAPVVVPFVFVGVLAPATLRPAVPATGPSRRRIVLPWRAGRTGTAVEATRGVSRPIGSATGVGASVGRSTPPRDGVRVTGWFSRNPETPRGRCRRFVVGTLTSWRASAVGSSTSSGTSARCRLPCSASSIGSGRAAGRSGISARSFNSGSLRSVLSTSRSGVVNSESSGGVGAILSRGRCSASGNCCHTGVSPPSTSGFNSSASTSW